MTTTVIVKAHCAASKEVNIITTDPHNPQPIKVLQDGETTEMVVYDSRTVIVMEVVKGETN